MKRAIKDKDKEAALKHLDQYLENGGAAKGIVKSIKTLKPMYGYTSEKTAEKGDVFIASLSADEKAELKMAQEYYENELMLPEKISDKLGEKGITEIQAKNALRHYINAMCK